MEDRKEKFTMVENISKDTEGKLFAARNTFHLGVTNESRERLPIPNRTFDQ